MRERKRYGDPGFILYLSVSAILAFLSPGLSRAGALVVRYESTGMVSWVRDWENNYGADQVALDESGNVFVVRYENGVVLDPQGDLIWQPSFNGNLFDIAVTRDGYSYWDCSTENACVAKFNLQGQLIWLSTLKGTSVLFLTLRTNEPPYVLTYCNEIEDDSRCLARLSEDGELLWTVWIEKPEDYDVAAADLELDQNGAIYVLGYLYPSSLNPGVLYKYDESGEMVWRVELADAGQPESFVVDEEGDSYVSYTRDNPSDDYGVYLKKVNSDGVEEWTEVADAGEVHAIRDVAISSTRQVVIASDDLTESYSQGQITVFDADGQVEWIYDLEGGAENGFETVTIADDGSVVAAGYLCNEAEEQAHDCRIVTIQFDTEGNVLWRAEYNSEGGDGESGNDLAVADNGDVVVVGSYSTGAEKEEEDSGCGC